MNKECGEKNYQGEKNQEEARLAMAASPGKVAFAPYRPARRMLLTDGVLLSDATRLSRGMLLNDNILISNGITMSNGTLMSDTRSYGDDTLCMSPE